MSTLMSKTLISITPDYIASLLYEYWVLTAFSIILLVVFIRSYRLVSNQYTKASQTIRVLNDSLVSTKGKKPTDVQEQLLLAIDKTRISYLKGSLGNHIVGIINSPGRTISIESRSFLICKQ